MLGPTHLRAHATHLSHCRAYTIMFGAQNQGPTWRKTGHLATWKKKEGRKLANLYIPKQSGRIVECNDPEEQSTYYKRLNCQEKTTSNKLISSSKQKTQKKNTCFNRTSPLFQPSWINPMDFHLFISTLVRTSSKNWASCTIAAMVRTSARFRSSSIGTLENCRFMASHQPSPPGG